MGCQGFSPSSHQTRTVQKNPVFVFVSGSHILNRRWSLEHDFLTEKHLFKMLLVSKWKYPRSVCEADLGSVLTVSCYGACPLRMSKCFCQQQQLLTSKIFFMHVHKCTNSFTASGHKNLLLDEPWTQPHPHPRPGDDGALKHEGITDKIRPITFSSSMDFFFCLYTNTLSTDLHMKRVQDCDRSKKKKKTSSPIKYCLSWSRNGKHMKSIIVTVATMIANIHIMSNKLRSMYNVEQKQHAGETTEPFYKTICRS